MILASERFAEVLNKAAQSYDTVVIDSAPVELVSDTKVLVTKASGVLYVIRANKTHYQAAQQGLKNMVQAGARLLGTVLNGMDPKEIASNHAHSRKYGKYHKYYSYGRYG